MQGNCRGTPAALRIVLSLSQLGKETSTLSRSHRYLPATTSRERANPLPAFVSISEYLFTPVRRIAITYCLDSKPYLNSRRVSALKTTYTSL